MKYVITNSARNTFFKERNPQDDGGSYFRTVTDINKATRFNKKETAQYYVDNVHYLGDGWMVVQVETKKVPTTVYRTEVHFID